MKIIFMTHLLRSRAAMDPNKKYYPDRPPPHQKIDKPDPRTEEDPPSTGLIQSSSSARSLGASCPTLGPFGLSTVRPQNKFCWRHWPLYMGDTTTTQEKYENTARKQAYTIFG